MNELRNSFHRVPPVVGRCDQVCIDTMRILDSCRDKDCYENVRCYLTDFGQEVIEKSGNIRVKNTEVVCANIIVDPIQFNRGFYQITIRFYTKLSLEACICQGKSQEIEGIAVTEKKVVLFGGEGGARVFKSTPCNEELPNGVHYLNCGSVALPKDGTPRSYLLYENGTFYFKDLETGGIFDCFTL